MPTLTSLVPSSPYILLPGLRSDSSPECSFQPTVVGGIDLTCLDSSYDAGELQLLYREQSN